MRQMLTVGLVLVLAFAATGCSDPYESSAEKLVSKTKEMVTILKGVKTEADATAASPKLEAIAKDFSEIAADLKKQAKPTDDQKKKVEKVFADAKKDMDELTKGDTLKADMAAMAKLGPAMEKVMKSMIEVQMQWHDKGVTLK